MNTHSVCFGSNIRKLGTPLQTLVFLYKGGVKGGIHFTDIFPDEHCPRTSEYTTLLYVGQKNNDKSPCVQKLCLYHLQTVL